MISRLRKYVLRVAVATPLGQLELGRTRKIFILSSYLSLAIILQMCEKWHENALTEECVSERSSKAQAVGLYAINLDFNELETFDVHLDFDLNITNSKLRTIFIRNATRVVYAGNNQITSLTVEMNSELRKLDLSGNRIGNSIFLQLRSFNIQKN